MIDPLRKDLNTRSFRKHIGSKAKMELSLRFVTTGLANDEGVGFGGRDRGRCKRAEQVPPSTSSRTDENIPEKKAVACWQRDG